MKTILYKLFGHKWKYYFTSSMSASKRQDIRVCTRTGTVQYLYTDYTKVLNDGKPFWMNCVGYTEKGAKGRHPEELLK